MRVLEGTLIAFAQQSGPHAQNGITYFNPG
jgi:hypothetical protein